MVGKKKPCLRPNANTFAYRIEKNASVISSWERGKRKREGERVSGTDRKKGGRGREKCGGGKEGMEGGRGGEEEVICFFPFAYPQGEKKNAFGGEKKKERKEVVSNK